MKPVITSWAECQLCKRSVESVTLDDLRGYLYDHVEKFHPGQMVKAFPYVEKHSGHTVISRFKWTG